MGSLDFEHDFYGTSCLSECDKCKFRKEGDSFLFRIADINKLVKNGHVNVVYDSLLFVLSGEISLSLNGSDNFKSFSKGAIFRLNSGDKIIYNVLSGVKILSLHFTNDLIARSKEMFQDFSIVNTRRFQDALEKFMPERRNSIYKTSMHPIFEKYALLFNDYLSEGCACSVYLELKLKELYMLILHFYPLDDVLNMLCPVLWGENSFRRFVLRNYSRVNNVNQLIEMSCMSKSLFFVKFKEEFGITAKQWLMERMNERIYQLFRQPNCTIKDVMYQLNFSSQSHFSRYCVSHLGCTPKELLVRGGLSVLYSAVLT